MITRQLLLAFSFILAQSVYAQRVETNITLRNEKGAYATVLLGYDGSATKGLDAGLGEFAIPGFPPYPAGLQAALAYKDNGLAVLSYRDYRPLPTSFPLQDTFSLITTPASDDSRGASLIFAWAYPLHPGIDSIVVSDLFGGLLYRCRLDAREADTLKGNALNLETFRIVLYASSLVTDVHDGLTTSMITNAKPRAVALESGILKLNMEVVDGTAFRCTDVSGRRYDVVSYNSTIDLSVMTPGVYSISSLQPDSPYRQVVMVGSGLF